MEKIEAFWNSFYKNKDSLESLSTVTQFDKENILNDLLEALHLYCDKLFFEVGEDSCNEKSEFIVTAEGNVDYFEKANALIEQAPVFSDWEFISLKPPMGIDFNMKYEEVYIDPSKLWFLPLENDQYPGKIGLKIGGTEIESINDKSNLLESAIYKIVDTVIGERSFALDVSHVIISDFSSDPDKESYLKLSNLSDFLTWKKRKIKERHN